MTRLLFLTALGLVLIVVHQPPSGGQPSPEQCTRCFEKLREDNRDCQSLQGQDWTVCREAAAEAYRRCSKGC